MSSSGLKPKHPLNEQRPYHLSYPKWQKVETFLIMAKLQIWTQPVIISEKAKISKAPCLITLTYIHEKIRGQNTIIF